MNTAARCFLSRLRSRLSIPISRPGNWQQSFRWIHRGFAGGVRPKPLREDRAEMDSLARFAVEQHNKMENADLRFVRRVSTGQQVVCGFMYYFTLEVIDGAGRTKFYNAKVWEKTWLNFKKLTLFKATDRI